MTLVFLIGHKINQQLREKRNALCGYPSSDSYRITLRLTKKYEMDKHGIILFDGVCNLCDGFVQRIIAADKEDFFRFASLQSEAGQNLLKPYPNLQDLKSIIYLEDGEIYTKSSAALKIGSHLTGSWKIMQAGYIFPKFIRDGVYNIIARYRYNWFGKKDQCMIPTPELKAKFL